MVKLVQLSKTYERGAATVVALHEVSLDVGRGEFCAFVGPSGCGKSTLLNLVGGLDRPSTGELFLDGRATTAFSSNDWTVARREVIGIVFQAFHLVPGLTALENVALPLVLRGEEARLGAPRGEEGAGLVQQGLVVTMPIVPASDLVGEDAAGAGGAPIDLVTTRRLIEETWQYGRLLDGGVERLQDRERADLCDCLSDWLVHAFSEQTQPPTIKAH